AADFEAAQLDQAAAIWPERRDIVGRIARLGHLQEQTEGHRAVPEPAFQLLAQEVRAPLAGIVRREKALPRLRHEPIAAGPAGAVLSREVKRVLGEVGRLPIARRDGPLHHAFDEAASGRMGSEKTWNRFRVRLAGRGVRELSAKKLE